MNDIALIERLLFESESVSLDFKSTQYRFVGATDDEKSELLKDVLAFANAWRRTDAYILIGVRDGKGGRGEVLGIADDMDDAQLQQFINSKTQRPVSFAYSSTVVEGKKVAAIRIPLQDRPIFLRQDYARLKAATVYVRRGSSTAIATPDEIAEMGKAGAEDADVLLDVFFASPELHQRVVPSLSSVVLETPSPKEIPNYQLAARHSIFEYPLRSANTHYYREIASFTRVTRLLSPVHLAVSNSGASTAHDVRLELRIEGADQGVVACDGDQYPSVPRSEYDHMTVYSLAHSVGRREPDLNVQRVGSTWLALCQTPKVQPKATHWFVDPLYVGATTSRTVRCFVKIFADNLQSPYEQELLVPIEATSRKVTLDEILELEDQRFRASPDHRRFLEEHGLGDET